MCQSFSMAPVRIAAMALAFIAATLSAQQAQVVHLSIKVTDAVGAVIPGARIQNIPLAGETRILATTSNRGEAAIDLPPGNRIISIIAKGFAGRNIKIDPKNGSDQTIWAALEGAPTIVDGVFIGGTYYAIPLEYPPVTAEIPLIPLEEFTAPAKPLRHKWPWL